MSAGAECEQCFVLFLFLFTLVFAVWGLGFEFYMFVAGWRQALRREWPSMIHYCFLTHLCAVPPQVGKAGAKCTASMDCVPGLVCNHGPSTAKGANTMAPTGVCAKCIPLDSSGCENSFSQCCQSSQAHSGANNCYYGDWCWKA